MTQNAGILLEVTLDYTVSNDWGSANMMRSCNLRTSGLRWDIYSWIRVITVLPSKDALINADFKSSDVGNAQLAACRGAYQYTGTSRNAYTGTHVCLAVLYLL